MEQEKQIVRIVPSTNTSPRRNLIMEELKEYEGMYLDEVERIIMRIADRNYGDEIQTIVIDKMLSPFQYWLQNKIACEMFEHDKKLEKK